MEEQFTPGPWKAHKRNDPIGYADYEVHFGDIGECVAEVVHVDADAKLISCAPDMLEVLEHIRDLPEFKNLWPHTKQIVLQVIAKAHGET